MMLRNLLFLLLLSGCSGPVITDTVVQKDSDVSVPDAQPMTLNSVQWQVLTLDQLKALVVKFQNAQQQNMVVFALDTTNYTNLSLNLAEIQRYIQEQKAILAMLKQIIAERAGQSSTSTSNSSVTQSTKPTGK